MALDGIFLNFLKTELENELLGSRVEKIHQPAKNEIILNFRSRVAAHKLLLSASGNAPRIHITKLAPENPQKPPMLCMLFRKHLTGAILKSIEQVGLDRVLHLIFDVGNEIGDRVKRTLIIEIMAQHSNIILLDEKDNIIDSIKRVDALKSSFREVLPGLPYSLPPSQDKLDMRHTDDDTIIDNLFRCKGNDLSSALLKVLQGTSPLLCRELAHKTFAGDVAVQELSEIQVSRLKSTINILREMIKSGKPMPTLVSSKENKPIDFSFMNIDQYGKGANVSHFDSLCQLIEVFYYERDHQARTIARAQDLVKLLHILIERTAKKLNNQKIELKESVDRDKKRIFAELIQANLHNLEKGSLYYELENYYDNSNLIRIPVKPDLTPVQNAQKYFKEYRKAQTAEKILTQQIETGEIDLEYLSSVLDEVMRSETEQELDEIRRELESSGYLKSKQNKKIKKQALLPPMEFVSPDGFKVQVGRNNNQNDTLSMKVANKSDLWFHTQKIPGSHVILQNQDKEITPEAMEFAAGLAAYFSSAREAPSVLVDYTQVRNLKKPSASRPGYVIYHQYKTMLVKPKKPD